MRAKRLRNGFIRKAGLRNSLMASGTAIDNVHPGKPNLIDAGAVIGNQPCVRAALRKTQIGTLVLFPFATVILERRDRQHGKEHHAGHRENEARAVRHLAHFFSRHEFSTARPTTNLGPGKTCQRR